MFLKGNILLHRSWPQSVGRLGGIEVLPSLGGSHRSCRRSSSAAHVGDRVCVADAVCRILASPAAATGCLLPPGSGGGGGGGSRGSPSALPGSEGAQIVGCA